MKEPVSLLVVAFFSFLTFCNFLGIDGLNQYCKCRRNNNGMVKLGYWLSEANDYVPNWSINTSFFTHLVYASGHLDENTFTVTVPPEESQILAGFSATMKKINGTVKTLFSIGGTKTNATVFSKMAADESLRKRFIDSSIALARQHGFHGLDLDWRFPATTGDMENFGHLLKEWRARLQEETLFSGLETLLLTSAVYFSEQFFDGVDEPGYPIQAITENLDWLNIMSFDYHNPWKSKKTGPISALYDVKSHFSTSYGIGSWIDAGVPTQKLIMGLPLFGRSWILKNKKKFGIGAPSVAAGPSTRETRQPGLMGFSEIRGFVKMENATVIVDNETVSAICYAKNLWVSFDSEETVAVKMRFARDAGLAGYFLWAVSYDLNWTLSTTASKTCEDYYNGRSREQPEIPSSFSFLFPSPSPSPSLFATDSSSGLSTAVPGSAVSKTQFSVYCLLHFICFIFLCW